MNDDRWVEVTASQFDHEREGLEYLRSKVPVRSPYRVWTNFEFRDTHGGWHEVDALLLGQDALYLIELKHFYGTITGNDRTWTRNGRTENSPLMLARRKAQRLASKLKDVYAEVAGSRPEIPANRIIPWVQEAVFLHHRDTKVLMPESSRISLYGLDELEATPAGLPGISRLIEERSDRRHPIHPQQEELLTLLLERIGLVQRREREVGSWVLVDGGAIEEGEGWQDWEASGKETGAPARIRFQTHTTDTERSIARALADHEFVVMRRLHHDGLIRPIDVVNDEQLGRGLVYDWDPSLDRLDHWLEDHGAEIDIRQRLQIIRDVGEVLEYAHGKGLAHRHLTPRSVWIGAPSTPDGQLTVKVSDWSAVGSSREESSTPGVTQHVARAAATEDSSLRTFQAPEGAWSATAADRPGLDQFALGALTYYLFAGKAPADTPQELLVRLREQSGLDLGVDLPEISEPVRQAVRKATSASPAGRHESLRDFLAGLDEAEQVPVDETLDPRDASAGDVLADGRFTVTKRLGKGSTALGLLVDDSEVTTQNKSRVLKVALDEKAEARLIEEADVLSRVKSRRVATLFEGPFPVGPTSALLLESAGESTLRDVLRHSDHGLPVDLLERYGNDLLQALEDLDGVGIDHRDIKPANLGIGKDSSKSWRLKLFDFSLSKAPAAEIDAGTAPYLDPFLGGEGRNVYDSAAERYAAAVALYEMTTGRHPQYGEDPHANPAAVTDDVTLDETSFPNGLRQDLTDFFSRALSRRATARFGTITEMRSAWSSMFGSATSTAPSNADDIAAVVTLETPLAEAGLSPRALSWFTGQGHQTVRDVVVLDSMQLSRTPGITKNTRVEVLGRAKEWRTRFEETYRAARRPVGDVPPLDEVADLLVAKRYTKRTDLHQKVLDLLLDRGSKHVDAFAPQVAISAILAAGTPPVNQALLDLHQGWSKDEDAGPVLDRVAAVVDAILDELGGVAAVSEIVTELIRRSGEGETAATTSASARRRAEGILRIVVDARRHRRRAGDDSEAPFEERRRGDAVAAIGRSGDLLSLALRLGDTVKDAAAELTGLLSAGRSRSLVLPLVDAVAEVGEQSPLRAGHRALRLGAVLSEGTAGVSSAGEVHRRDLPPAEALRLALGDLPSDVTLLPGVVQERFAARFPQLSRLPGRPQLDSVIAESGVALRYDEPAKKYVGPTVTGDTTMLTERPATATLADRSEVEDTAITRRLEESRRRRSYLVLGTIPSRLADLETALENRFAARRVNVASLLLEAMHGVLEDNPGYPGWDVIMQADAGAAGSRERLAVTKVVELAMPAVTARLEEALTADGAAADDRAPLVLSDVDMLVHYGQAGELRRLSDLSVSRDRAVWVIAPQYEIHTGPEIDGVRLTTSPHQFLDVDYAWSDVLSRPVTPEPNSTMEDAL
ncbi:BREX system serine/threonine kinase PglW [Brachybacterium tyrofermentans]|uniref:BREX system serine/threonine kinase PglW n=1 Tax=Brachybacterium tyrofermentans TaxID=47848 RepID=UPI003FCFEE83